MQSNFSQSADLDVIQRPLALQPKKGAFNRLPLAIQRLKLDCCF